MRSELNLKSLLDVRTGHCGGHGEKAQDMG